MNIQLSRSGLAAAAMLATLVLATQRPAQADTLTFELGHVFTGSGTPAGDVPWVVVTFEEIANGDVRLTIDTRGLLTSATDGLTGSEFVSNFFFNFDTATITGLQLVFDEELSDPFEFPLGGDNGIFIGNNDQNAGAGTMFDVNINLPPPPGGPNNTLNSPHIAVFTISADQDLTKDDFDFLSANGDPKDWPVAAHVQSLTGGASAWITDGGGPGGTDIDEVPEPSSLVLLGAGALGLFGFGRRRRKTTETVA